MREESHLDEMRDAIRGDFERLAERRGEQELLRVTEPEESAAAEEPALDLEQEVEAGSEPLPDTEPEEAERRSWLARIFSA